MSDEEFVKKMIELVELFGANVICEEMRISRPTIIRWVQGRNLPHPALRDSFESYYKIKKAFDIPEVKE